MCTNAVKTVGSIMVAIEPTLNSLLTETHLITTPEGAAAIAAFDAAATAANNWVSGTVAENVLELIGDFQAVFNALPIPTEYAALINIILAGIETVIGVLAANSPAPAAPSPVAASAAAAPEEIQAMHVAHTVADTTAKVQQLVPGFKRSIWHSPASQYKTAWNSAVDSGKFPQTLKTA